MTPDAPSCAPNLNEQLVTRQQLTIRWACSLSFVKRKQNEGMLTAIRLGDNSVRYRLSEVAEIEHRLTEVAKSES